MSQARKVSNVSLVGLYDGLYRQPLVHASFVAYGEKFTTGFCTVACTSGLSCTPSHVVQMGHRNRTEAGPHCELRSNLFICLHSLVKIQAILPVSGVLWSISVVCYRCTYKESILACASFYCGAQQCCCSPVTAENMHVCGWANSLLPPLHGIDVPCTQCLGTHGYQYLVHWLFSSEVGHAIAIIAR